MDRDPIIEEGESLVESIAAREQDIETPESMIQPLDTLTTYQNMFNKVINDILVLDQKDKLTAADKSQRDGLIRKRKNIEDMLQSLRTNASLERSFDMGGGKRRKFDREVKVDYTKYSPDYPSFEKGDRKDIKSPLMFIQALRIALQSSHLPKTDWIPVFLNRLGVTLAEEILDAIKYYNEKHE